jgi:hypothetical protein
MNGSEAVLLCAYDAESQSPYATLGRVFFGLGMVLRKTKPVRVLAGLELELVKSETVTIIDHHVLENIRQCTPSATALPLLVALAQKKSDGVTLYYSDDLGLLVTLCF